MQNCDYLNSKKCYVILTHRRFIPVCTGNTSEPGIDPMSKAGLSLCIQGTRSRLIQINQCPRFIPVHTGNTVLIIVYSVSITVYPCAYREHKALQNPAVCPRGLSLCIQGTYFVRQVLIFTLRFIPVHTGNIV